MFGKRTSQGMFLLEHIYKGEKYTVYKTAKNKVHIIPDKKLKEIIHQAVAEERKRMVREARQTLKKEDSDIVERVIDSLDKPLKVNKEL